MKKILIIQGGGRKNGNTARLVSQFVKGVQEAGHNAEVISLMEKEVKGCLGCNACRYENDQAQDEKDQVYGDAADVFRTAYNRDLFACEVWDYVIRALTEICSRYVSILISLLFLKSVV